MKVLPFVTHHVECLHCEIVFIALLSLIEKQEVRIKDFLKLDFY